MIVDSLMQYGSFDVELQGLKDTVRQYPWQFETILFTTERVADPTAANIRAQAFWAGRVDKWFPGSKRRPAKASGKSLLVWAGDSDNKGAFLNGGTAIAGPIGTTLGAWLATGGLMGTPAYTNGLTLGDTSGVSGNNINDELKDRENLMQGLQRWIRCTTNLTEFRLNPDLSMDFAAITSSAIFTQTPVVVLCSDGPVGKHGGFTFFRPAVMERTEDYTRWTRYISNTNTAIPITVIQDNGSTIKAADGSTTIATAKKIQDAPSADAGIIGSNALNYEYITHYEWDLEVEDVAFLDVCKTGDRIYVWDQEQGITDGAHEILGGSMFPQLVRITGMRIPVKDPMGCYAIRNCQGSNAVVDLSDHYVRQTGNISLEIDDKPVTLTDVVNGTVRT